MKKNLKVRKTFLKQITSILLGLTISTAAPLMVLFGVIGFFSSCNIHASLEDPCRADQDRAIILLVLGITILVGGVGFFIVRAIRRWANT